MKKKSKEKRENEQFVLAIKRGKAKGIALVTNKLMESIKGGNITGMIFFLKTQAGWKETNVQEHTGANGTALQAPVFNIVGVAPKDES